jgi:hypothetical protein
MCGCARIVGISIGKKFMNEDIYEPLEDEMWECKCCGWIGDRPYLQEIKIFDDVVFICPECGEIL